MLTCYLLVLTRRELLSTCSHCTLTRLRQADRSAITTVHCLGTSSTEQDLARMGPCLSPRARPMAERLGCHDMASAHLPKRPFFLAGAAFLAAFFATFFTVFLTSGVD